MDTVTPASQARIFLVDDATEVRRRVARLLILIPGIEIAGECAGVDDAFDSIVASRADIAVLDPCWNGKTNLFLITALARYRPAIVSIVLTNHCATPLRHACKRAGANFFFDKTAEFNLACRVVESIANARGAHSA